MRNKILIIPVNDGYMLRHSSGPHLLTFTSIDRMINCVKDYGECEVYVECKTDESGKFCSDNDYTAVRFIKSFTSMGYSHHGVLYIHCDGKSVEEKLQTLANLESALVDNRPMSKWVYATPLVAVILVALCLKVFS